MENENSNRPRRFDTYGNPIIKGSSEKKHKIVFADNEQVQERHRELVEIFYVESYKAYNTDMSR
jgi:hypothetical protein